MSVTLAVSNKLRFVITSVAVQFVEYPMFWNNLDELTFANISLFPTVVCPGTWLLVAI